ncbi:winged helix-turn-helix transcriptional regulator [Mucilaginibacter sp. P25]|uniref:Helix-turn-helix transcriptional regulator n=2 Tax=Mucilaginibacter TaxID=423349 RepID=A0AAE6MGH8_9SPHI|nr:MULTISPECIES: helix-turn-helix domain-containing protein [Mucilaginibacter]QEM02526.1 helix-turn-helix transcriptional regulator [Mucilaginibacter rubeus]QEM15146.1 helix-turn-helix transcriptional regulator [Mucilaginibacter gossypii]QTE42131.1 helix-turn-helix transcriptional regulator [Mucilaginibacter rubeus]QTE48732.1 helix-turn-helix transcriptional regulator [Mucilaginibacter rubeus]QTE53830.1 helix-turn-helix transcriptional regulator [Mucilaginibacter rubeus]
MRKMLQNPENCAVVRTVGYIGNKWKPIILVRLLNGGKVRFGKLCVQMADISRKILSQQLKELEEDGLIIRHTYMEKPPRVEYELSELGKTLIPVLKAMYDWGNQIALPEQQGTWDPVVK